MSLVILFLVAVTKVFHNRIRAGTWYLIWTLVLLRLLFPFDGIFLPSVFEIAIPDTYIISYSKDDVPEPVKFRLENQEILFEKTYNDESVSKLSGTQISGISGNTQEEEYHPSVDAIIYAGFILYLTGVCVSFVSRFLPYLWFIRDMNRSGTDAPDETYRIYELWCRKLKIRHPPKLYVNYFIRSPLLYGFFRPCILLTDFPDTESASGVLVHELTHHRRGDLWVNLLSLCVSSLYWFHPLVHYAVGQCARAMEFSCDEQVLHELDEDARQRYETVMLDIMQHRYGRSAALTTYFRPGKNTAAERFFALRTKQKKESGIRLVVLTVLLCLMSGFLIGFTETKPETSVVSPETESIPAAKNTPLLGTAYSSWQFGSQKTGFGQNGCHITSDGKLSFYWQSGALYSTAPPPEKMNSYRDEELMLDRVFISEPITIFVKWYRDELITWMTHDCGENWQIFRRLRDDELLQIDTARISFYSKEEGYLILSGTAGTGKQQYVLYHTKNHGTEWTRVQPDVFTELPMSLSGFMFANDREGAAVFGNGDTSLSVYHTADGGLTWNKVTLFEKILQDYSYSAYCPLTPYFGSDGSWVLPVILYDSEEAMLIFLKTYDKGLTFYIVESDQFIPFTSQ